MPVPTGITNLDPDDDNDGILDTKEDTTETSKKQLTLAKKIEQIQVGQNIILKGQILDKETNQPVPFANLILKKEEIYRNFQLKTFFTQIKLVLEISIITEKSF